MFCLKRNDAYSCIKCQYILSLIKKNRLRNVYVYSFLSLFFLEIIPYKCIRNSQKIDQFNVMVLL